MFASALSVNRRGSRNIEVLTRTSSDLELLSCGSIIRHRLVRVRGSGSWWLP